MSTSVSLPGQKSPFHLLPAKSRRQPRQSAGAAPAPYAEQAVAFAAFSAGVPAGARALVDAYAQWAVEIWGGDTASGHDLAIMGLGIAGECSEVLTELLGSQESREALANELGDVVYYWARIARAYDLVASDCMPFGVSVRAMASQPQDLLALQLARACGQVSERLKKHLRDPGCAADAAGMAATLQQTALYWAALCEHRGFDWREILALNRDKLERRRANGTLTSGHGELR